MSGLKCDSCVGVDGASTKCRDWKKECMGREYNYCIADDHKCYANKEKTEALLKEWDDKNGSIAEWRENDIPMKKWSTSDHCSDCIGYGDCPSWGKSLGFAGETCGAGHEHKKHLNRPDCYANKKQTEALLKWHDEKYGSIQDRLKKEDAGWSRVVYESGKDLDFQVGDSVTVVGKLAIFESKIDDVGKGLTGHPVRIMDERKMEYLYFSVNGEGGDRLNEIGLKLHHGHNLKIDVEKKSPVRTTDGWIFLYQKPSQDVKSLKTPFTDIKDCKETIAVYKMLGNTILSDPIKVQIPAQPNY